jgi:hypothetical protein
MHDLIPVTVIEHQGPFPPTAYDHLTYQFKTIEQAAAEFTTRVNAHPSVIYIDRTRNIIWIPYAGWTPKEQE